jgi:hypothetical protein
MPATDHRHRAVTPPTATRRVVPGFWSAVPTREALSLDERRRIADFRGAADIVTANGMVLCLR